MKFGICYCYWNKDWEGKDYQIYRKSEKVRI